MNHDSRKDAQNIKKEVKDILFPITFPIFFAAISLIPVAPIFFQAVQECPSILF
jgi:hypothetical protein